MLKLGIDHGKTDKLVYGTNWKKARFKKLKKSSFYFRNDLAFLGRIGKARLSEIYELGLVKEKTLVPKYIMKMKISENENFERKSEISIDLSMCWRPNDGLG